METFATTYLEWDFNMILVLISIHNDSLLVISTMQRNNFPAIMFVFISPPATICLVLSLLTIVELGWTVIPIVMVNNSTTNSNASSL